MLWDVSAKRGWVKVSAVVVSTLIACLMLSAPCYAYNGDSTGGPSLGGLADAFSYRQPLRARSSSNKQPLEFREISTEPLLGLDDDSALTGPEIVLPEKPQPAVARVSEPAKPAAEKQKPAPVVVAISDDSFFEDSAACADVDDDGVCDARDHCMHTPPGEVVLPTGCHLTLQAPVELTGVFFDFNGHKLRPESKEILDRAAALLRQRQYVTVEVAGHTDGVGNPDVNLRLSRQRARSVYDYLVAQGVPAYRLSYRGYGAQLPVQANRTRRRLDNPDGRARNRRVDLRVTGTLAARE